MIRALLPMMKIPEEMPGACQDTFFRWATHFEDTKLGLDCWLVVRGVEIAVDFTIISDPSLIGRKEQMALDRGVIPVFIPRTLLIQAYGIIDDSCNCVQAMQAVRELSIELSAQKLSENPVKFLKTVS